MKTETEKHVEANIEAINPCLLCKSHEGPSKTFVRNFHRPLKHILQSINSLDFPLAPNDLRVHLAVLRVILTQLLNSLNVTMTHDREVFSNTIKKVDNETRPALAVVDARKTLTNLACPDRYLGSLAGYPRYKKGFVILNCTSTRLEEVITVVMWNVDHSPDLFKYWTNTNIQIYIISNFNWNVSSANVNYLTSEIPGDVMPLILQNISTPYVLLAPYLHSLRDNINFNRLIYVSERTGASAVGGSIRSEEDGRWRSGCQLYKEYEGQIAFKRAYSASDFECQLCHFTDGAVLVKMNWLKGSGWPPKSVPSEMLMPYLFFDLNRGIKLYQHPVLVCPDVLFRYHSIFPSWDAEYTKSTFVETKFHLQSLWDSTARTRHLTSIYLPSGIKLNYPCHYVQTSRRENHDLKEFYIKNKSTSKTGIRTCKEAELNHILSTIIHNCEKVKIVCALDERFVGVLIQYGDPMKLHQKFEKIPVGVEVVGRNDTYRRLQELLINQIKGITTEKSSLEIEGYFWNIKISPNFGQNLFHYKRIQVLENLWMKGHFTHAVFDPFNVFDTSILNQTSPIKVIERVKGQGQGQGQDPDQGQGFLRMVSESFEDASQQWEFYTSRKSCI